MNINIDNVNFDDLFINGSPVGMRRKSVLADEIRRLIPKFGKNKFTVRVIEIALQRVGYKNNAKQPRARIATALAKLVNESFVIVVESGRGNQPSVYLINPSYGQCSAPQK